MTAATAIRATLRADLKAAMQCRDRALVGTLRELIAALDSAEAVTATGDQARKTFRKLGDPSGEVARRELTEQDVTQILDSEITAREAAAVAYARAGREDEAEALRQSAAVAARYRPG